MEDQQQDDAVVTSELDALYLSGQRPAPTVGGFDTAALFLLDLQFPNLFEPATAKQGTLERFRCKGCRAVLDRSGRERHYNNHKRHQAQYSKEKKLSATETKPASKPKTPPKPNAKDLGVPDKYLGETGSFRPGMDARLKSDLICAILEIPAPNALVKFSQDEAKKLFAQFPQWKGFLIRKQEILDEKAKEKEAKAKDKAEAAKTKAAEKKTAAKTSAKSGGSEVTPDPKPSKK